MILKENIALAPLTTLGVGGLARWFVEAASEDEIAEAAAWAAKKNMPIFCLGGGSNLLVSDAGFDGLVLQIKLPGFSVDRVEGSENECQYRVGAGEKWDTFVQRTIDHGCAGLECLAGIPGTVGGTPVQNVGAYGQEVDRVIERVRAFDLFESSFIELARNDCGFGYRKSRFNTADRGRFIVTRVDLRLRKGGFPLTGYVDLSRLFSTPRTNGERPTVAAVAAEVRRVRQSKGMLLVADDTDCRSAGSFFKNPVIPETELPRISSIAGAEPPRFAASDDPATVSLVKVPAAWLIEKAGFTKGYKAGAAGISSRHTLAIVNRGGATAAEILTLARTICREVEAKFGIKLEMEPVMLGF